MPDTTCIVFVEEAVDKRNKLYKKVKDLGHIAEMKRQDSAQLARWAATILAQNGRKITPSTMNLFWSASAMIWKTSGWSWKTHFLHDGQ